MSAANVWACICAYNYDSAKELTGNKYGYTPRLAVVVLEGYPGRKAYHGHISGKGGDGENKAASDNRVAAITYLQNNTDKLVSAASKKLPDKQKEMTNRDHTKRLTDVIDNVNNFGLLPNILALIDPDWEGLREVKDHFNFKRAEKKKNK